MHLSYIYIHILIQKDIYFHTHIFTYISYHLQEKQEVIQNSTNHELDSTQINFTNSSEFFAGAFVWVTVWVELWLPSALWI